MNTLQQEIIEPAIGVVDGVNTLYKTSRPYVPGSLTAYLNGLLQERTSPTGWVETNPTTGDVTLSFAPQELDDIQFGYLDATGAPLFVDPFAPRHITKIKPDDILRVSMRAGKQLDVLRQDGPYHMATPIKAQRARGYSKTIFICVVVENDVTNSTLTVDFTDTGNSQIHYIAKFKYSDMLRCQLYFAGALPMVETSITVHPGSKALGTKSFNLYQLSSEKLVNVVF